MPLVREQHEWGWSERFVADGPHWSRGPRAEEIRRHLASRTISHACPECGRPMASRQVRACDHCKAAARAEFGQRQGGTCAICGAAPAARDQLHLDHCHDTGRLRGLLCGNCNRGLGMLGDDPEVIRRAAHYLETHGAA